MDTSEYMPMFLAEAQEHLESLNLAVVRLEENPADRDTVDEIFRMAHSIKGMSATMGFARLAELTHAMEDVFELLRQRRGGHLTGRDRHAAGVRRCALRRDRVGGGDRHRGLDPAALVERLRGLVWARTPEQTAEPELSMTALDLRALGVDGERVLHVVATLSEAVLMPAARAHMVLAALTEHGELLASAPQFDEVEQFHGRRDRGAAAQRARGGCRPGQALDDLRRASTRWPRWSRSQDDRRVASPPARAPAAARCARWRRARTVRVEAERLDALMHSMGELVIHRTRVQELTAGLTVPGLQQAMQELARSSPALQALVMQVRMMPVEAVFLRLPRLVRDIASQAGQGGQA